MHEKKQITGVEPAFPAWEASVLPMNHICMLLSMTYYFLQYVTSCNKTYYSTALNVCKDRISQKVLLYRINASIFSKNLLTFTKTLYYYRLL